ncbi:MAG: 16S rRNA (guanine(966)-N(2))-methyltransferase RsmD [Candidatus Brocadiia bacterium]
MRIIAGSAGGLVLRTPRGRGVRPTSGRVRTSLFSILGPTVAGARAADLFAGCGALGIEALSRGAAWCCFVETGRGALAALAENLRRARLADRAEVLRCDAFRAAAHLVARGPLDLVFLDPPYALVRRDLGRLLALLEALAPGLAAEPPGLLVVQHPARAPLPDAAGPLAAADRRAWGGTAVTFFERAASP